MIYVLLNRSNLTTKIVFWHVHIMKRICFDYQCFVLYISKYEHGYVDTVLYCMYSKCGHICTKFIRLDEQSILISTDYGGYIHGFLLSDCASCRPCNA